MTDTGEEKFDLTEEVKGECSITWDDPRLESQIKGAMAYVRSKVGNSVSFDDYGLAVTLLANRVRYQRNGATAFFETDFRSDILTLQLELGKRGGNSHG